MKISKDMTIGEVARNYPECVDILFDFGMGCVGCPSAQAETIEEACQVHGIEVEKIIKALNEGLK
ncbi:DUF1858 domain-containing protein [Clostridium sp. cel8]|jgi:hybrid cluster-associated redox disulfide protein|uniref:DUF1858 domain-containing protein n=1 Tax=unclassified Clostridium TaxID=2614128 RepID=UPI0015F63866|nr:DUF1858 domain-containing protein [Clostridium sp. cel8]MBA5851527.1 DUF1858 domain-containing protein [Clostridium sp. cel8]